MASVLQASRPDSLKRRESPSFLHDEKGKPRLNMARAVLLDREGEEPDLQTLKGLYLEWVNNVEFVVLAKITGIDKREIVAVPCSKRGNEIYYRRNQRRFRHLWRNMEKIGGSIFDPRGNLKRTKLLFGTLTWNSKGRNLRDSWEFLVSKEFNSWITAVRMKYGRVSVIRSWESFKSGYPHVQVLLYFHDKEFNVFRHGNKFRVQEKGDLQCGWPSHVDIQAMHSWRGAVRYVGKYILKQLASESVGEPEAQNKQLLTLSLCWIFRKRSYSMSRDFLDLISLLRNSKSLWVQVDFEGAPVLESVTWVFIGVFSFRELGIPPILRTQHIEPSR